MRILARQSPSVKIKSTSESFSLQVGGCDEELLQTITLEGIEALNEFFVECILIECIGISASVE